MFEPEFRCGREAYAEIGSNPDADKHQNLPECHVEMLMDCL